jgi:leucyl aminopeptidase
MAITALGLLQTRYESDIADVKNYSGKPVAGAISAAKFLEYFTQEHAAWAHLDIAGVAFGDDEFAKVNMQLHMAFIY